MVKTASHYLKAEVQKKAAQGVEGLASTVFSGALHWTQLRSCLFLSADPFGGVIITDWYGPPESQGERFKLNIFILGTSLRSDGVRATVFRQTKGREGSWMDASRDEKLDRDVEDSILTRARELKINSLPQR